MAGASVAGSERVRKNGTAAKEGKYVGPSDSDIDAAQRHPPRTPRPRLTAGGRFCGSTRVALPRFAAPRHPMDTCKPSTALHVHATLPFAAFAQPA
ncbi:hypothetical protein GCM10022295_70380 [Streptomyces osmaniensis]|uniref:Uncharacterized protein n=1 Tax=Streptomyces osmaniensis TaxID=593134 RepID=A0ABP6Y9U6_9ACTN